MEFVVWLTNIILMQVKLTVKVLYGLLATPNAQIWEMKNSPVKVTCYVWNNNDFLWLFCSASCNIVTIHKVHSCNKQFLIMVVQKIGKDLRYSYKFF